MKQFILLSFVLLITLQSKAQLVINEVSQGTSGNKEYIELVVTGTRSCIDTFADLRGWIVDDNGGWYSSSAISQGCYRFANVPSWSHVPYGSIILLFNDGDKNGLITQADDPTDANLDHVYIVPITSNVIELNGSAPSSASGSSFSYPNSGFSTSTSWTPMAFNNNGDAVSVVKPTVLNSAYHSMTYGNISGGTVHLTGSGGQKVYYVSGSQYNSSAGWVSGNAPSNETPGTPNTTANATWINGMLASSGGGSAFNDTTVVSLCQGQSQVFNGNTYNTTGNYTFTYHLSSGCDSIITLALTIRPVPTAPVVITPVIYCQNDAAVALIANGQNLLWYTVPTGGTGSATAPIPNTSITGSTNFYLSQSLNGCESPRTLLMVNIKPKPAPPVVTTPIFYCQRATAIALTANGVNLQWYPSGAGGTATGIAPIPSTTIPGTFSWFVSQTQDGCESDRNQVDVTVNEIKATFSILRDTVCSMDTVKLSNLSLGAGLTYNWDFGDGTTDQTAIPVHIYSTSGLYTIQLTVTNAAGCTDTATHKVFILPLPLLSFTKDHATICQGAGVQLQGTMTPYYKNITWDFGDGLQESNVEQVQHSYDTSGTFIITLTTVNTGCPDRIITDTLIVYPHPVVNIGADTAMCPGNPPIPVMDLAFHVSPVTYRWNTGDSTQGILARTPGKYSVEVSNGQCSSADSMEVLNSCYINIPNTFTPNRDGLNDYFFPRQLLSRALTEFSMQIFSRWGQLIFESKAIDGRGWDGDFNGLAQPQGVYVYLITAAFANGVRERYQGNITLVR